MMYGDEYTDVNDMGEILKKALGATAPGEARRQIPSAANSYFDNPKSNEAMMGIERSIKRIRADAPSGDIEGLKKRAEQAEADYSAHVDKAGKWWSVLLASMFPTYGNVLNVLTASREAKARNARMDLDRAIQMRNTETSPLVEAAGKIGGLDYEDALARARESKSFENSKALDVARTDNNIREYRSRPTQYVLPGGRITVQAMGDPVPDGAMTPATFEALLANTSRAKERDLQERIHSTPYLMGDGSYVAVRPGDVPPPNSVRPGVTHPVENPALATKRVTENIIRVLAPSVRGPGGIPLASRYGGGVPKSIEELLQRMEEAQVADTPSMSKTDARRAARKAFLGGVVPMLAKEKMTLQDIGLGYLLDEDPVGVPGRAATPIKTFQMPSQ